MKCSKPRNPYEIRFGTCHFCIWTWLTVMSLLRPAVFWSDKEPILASKPSLFSNPENQSNYWLQNYLLKHTLFDALKVSNCWVTSCGQNYYQLVYKNLLKWDFCTQLWMNGHIELLNWIFAWYLTESSLTVLSLKLHVYLFVILYLP